MNGQKEQVILAIESAICGGSISLLRFGVEIASSLGSSTVSKAEDMLADIATMLDSAGISRSEIDMVAVSAGPGSFTGIRIGIATALGLKAGLGIVVASETSLKAIARMHRSSDSVTVAVPVGRDAVCVQRFQLVGDTIVANDEPRTIPEQKFDELLDVKTSRFLVHGELYKTRTPANNITNFGDNIALAIGLACSTSPPKMVEPLFISKGF